MARKFILAFTFIFIFASLNLVALAANPTPAPLYPPTYNYSEASSCVICHFTLGATADHMLQAVGVTIDANNTAFSFSGGGWLASRHSQSNYGSTQNTFCAKCHSPLQATPQATFNNGALVNTAPVANGAMQAVTCGSCHPPHNAVPRLGIFQFGDPTKVTSYQLIQPNQEDLLCLNCHVERHNETNAAFTRMYNAGVQCVDCHMAVFGLTSSGLAKREHNFKVAENLPYSCGVQGSVSGYECHPGFTAQATLAFIPSLKEQHIDWWPLNPSKRASGTAVRSLVTAEDYLALWQEIQNQIGQ